MRIAITGHTKLPAQTLTLVDAALRRELAALDTPPLTGVSLLADGPDQLFAQAVLDLGGTLEVFVVQPEHRHFADGPFTALLGKASSVDYLPAYATPTDAWTAAAERMLDAGIDLLIAVWDGSPPAGGGGTADVVQRAEKRDIPVTVVWPLSARRH